MDDDWIERAVGMIGRAAECDSGIAFIPEFGAQRVHQPGLADAGLARDQHHLPDARQARLPGAAQQPELGRAPHEARERARMRRLEAAPRGALARDAPHRDGVLDALERTAPQVREIEGLADQ